MRKFTKNIFLFVSLLGYLIGYSQPQITYTDKISIGNLFAEAIAAKAFPGGCIIAGTATKIFIDNCYGFHTYAEITPDVPNSLFDLASLTKVIATTSAIMKLYEEGKIRLDDKVVKYLPEFIGNNPVETKLKSEITIRDLLTHTSGLPPDDDKINSWDNLYKTSLIDTPEHAEIYSDVNFLLLGKIIEKISGLSLASYTYNNIFKPLGMHSTFFNPDQRQTSLIVPTIFDFKTDKNLQGIVNDPFARVLGGIAGNAGLFSNSHDLAVFAQMMLNQGSYKGIQIFKPSTVALFTAKANVLLNSSRALGWDTAFNLNPIASKEQFTAGLYIDSDAYGHTGYTGTSMWISSKHDIFVILLTNRLFPYHCAAKLPVEKYWRQRLNSAVWEKFGFNKRNILEEMSKPHLAVSLSDCPLPKA